MKGLARQPLFYLSLVLAGALVFQMYGIVAAQGTYTAPPGPPPAGNPAQPLNTGGGTQYKLGSFGIGNASENILLKEVSSAREIFFTENTVNAAIKLDPLSGKLLFRHSGGPFQVFGGGGVRMEIFDKTGAFTVPEYATNVVVEMWGGGGGGGGGASFSGHGGGGVGCGAGGGGGGYGKYSVAVSLGSVLPVVVGAGGKAGTNGSDNNIAGEVGGKGDSSSFKGKVVTGGAGGGTDAGGGGVGGTFGTGGVGWGGSVGGNGSAGLNCSSALGGSVGGGSVPGASGSGGYGGRGKGTENPPADGQPGRVIIYY